MKNSEFYYSVGPLLYCPANHTGVKDSLIAGRFGSHFSMTFCLEDTIRDDSVEAAEQILIHTLQALQKAQEETAFYLPKIFIRVRSAAQISKLYRALGAAAGIVAGFNAPKFSPENAAEYIRRITEINEVSPSKVYLMPIMENTDMISLKTRVDFLYDVKEHLDSVSDLILNVRVGGNDLCHAFGFRRNCNETIYDIRPIADLLSDIVTVFGRDYVISGPVWEYYNGDGWDSGMRRELECDRQMGFIGKTVIHPKQIPLVNEAYKVSRKDYEDALAILNWNPQNVSLVSGSQENDRMNEFKTHRNWAEKILFLAKSYGIRQE